MDKNINTFTMRLKEWFSWHFPELSKIVNDGVLFTKIVHLVQNKDRCDESILPQLEEILMDEDKAKEVVEAAKTSMGQDMSEMDQI